STRLVVPANITIIALPPKCPELNPVENVWQFMRDNWLSNRIFKSYDDLVDHCCEAWNKLVDQPWRIMSIGLRQWAHEFRSMGLGISANRDFSRRSKKHRYSITLSARAISVGGTVKPSAFAVLRLMTSSNLFGCCTGRSTSFVP